MIRTVGVRRLGSQIAFSPRSSCTNNPILSPARFRLSQQQQPTTTLARSRLYSTSTITRETSSNTNHDPIISSTSTKSPLQPKLQVSVAQIAEQFEQLKPEKVAQDLLEETSEAEKDDVKGARKVAEQLTNWYRQLSEDEQEEFTCLWRKPHVRYAANEMSADPRVYRRFINNKDVVRYIEITGIRPWESMPTTDEEYPVSSMQDVQTKWVYLTGLEKKEFELGGPKVMFPEKFNRNRVLGDWGTFQDPILVPTTQQKRIIECLGYCHPSLKGIERSWTMNVNDVCVCRRCLQVFLCFDATVYEQPKSEDNSDGEHKPDQEEHKSDDQQNEYKIEPVKNPPDIVKEYLQKRSQENKEIVRRQVAKQIAKSERRTKIVEGIKAWRNARKNTELAKEASELLKKMITTPVEDLVQEVLKREDIDENVKGNGLSLWLARRKVAKREIEDKKTIRRFYQDITEDEKRHQDRSRKTTSGK